MLLTPFRLHLPLPSPLPLRKMEISSKLIGKQEELAALFYVPLGNWHLKRWTWWKSCALGPFPGWSLDVCREAKNESLKKHDFERAFPFL